MFNVVFNIEWYKLRCYFNTLIVDIFCDVCVFDVKLCVVLACGTFVQYIGAANGFF